MAPSATATTTAPAVTPAFRSGRSTLSRTLRKPAISASTPDLNSLFVAQSRLAPPGLVRKASFVALISSSLASIADVSESYALDSVLSDSSYSMAPTTPGRPAADDVTVGEPVDVPGGMHGTLRFVGSVQGKKGVFAGVELHQEFSAKGKNSGDVDGVSYFATNTPGAGIFVPMNKIARRGASNGSMPITPTVSAFTPFKNGGNSTHFTPPAPALHKFSASVGPGARAPSPQNKRPRTSLPRPDSPLRRTQMTPGPRPSLGALPRVPTRLSSPTNKLAQSVRGPGGDPNKKPLRPEGKSGHASRSTSAMDNASNFDDDATPVGMNRSRRNGSIGSVSSLGIKMHRPASRAQAVMDDEIERLRSQLEDRDRQLKEQAATLAEMESSLVELQMLLDHPDGGRARGNENDDKDSAQLRHLLREKNDKIAMLTAEFDAHRADFRSTIDTLELASSETERVYEKRIEELVAELRELESRNLDVDSVASQLKQLEELVQELEEGLEDARRGEAEARGEAEFLRGEVERTRSELRRERDKGRSSSDSQGDGVGGASKELEQKEDEIRGLKAIIHSLSRDAVPGADGRATHQRPSSLSGAGGDLVEDKIARDNLERQVAELHSLLDRKSSREQELELELETLRSGGHGVQGSAPMPPQRSNHRDSRDTIIPAVARTPETPRRRGNRLDTMHESDTHSTATETSTLWCEICETSGHDILTCTNMFGPESVKNGGDTKSTNGVEGGSWRPDVVLHADDAQPAPLSPIKTKVSAAATPVVRAAPDPMDSGPIAGKESGVVDLMKWCAICERDGHDSVDCPFEDAF